MSLLVTSVVPYPICLEGLELDGLDPAWVLHASSADDLAESPCVMNRSDVYAMSFQLTTPVKPGPVELGRLALRCRRCDDKDMTAREASAKGQWGTGMSAAMCAPVSVLHQLPSARVVEAALCARLHMPSLAKVDEELTVALSLVNCLGVEMSVRADVGVLSSDVLHLGAEESMAICLAANSETTVRWLLRTLRAGVGAVSASMQIGRQAASGSTAATALSQHTGSVYADVRLSQHVLVAAGT
jgi:hypothetical protein